ncbi:TPA: hypothetical protein NI607_005601 [Pseudomonas aeruginosa]|nr:hypothetical protein [Pseudomonas aeruginosa]HCF9241822.1 hypothetical protein [Pseudomonas aeruginosa]HCF9261392.1 hypothetical protein [Pseudomonas aeruginosa]HCF9326215.1 hypothetical protein [Pseudomonas aeruginosa]HCF9391446.1 hypothetical protein [Pseudomonas aeruginosa]
MGLIPDPLPPLGQQRADLGLEIVALPQPSRGPGRHLDRGRSARHSNGHFYAHRARLGILPAGASRQRDYHQH